MRAEVHVITCLHAGIAPAVLWDRSKWLLACSFTVTTQLSSAGKRGHKRACGGGTINIFRAHQHSSSVGFVLFYQVTLCKEQTRFQPLAQTGRKPDYGPLLGTAPWDVKQVGIFHVGRRHKDKVNTDCKCFPSLHLSTRLSGLSPLWMYVMMVSPTVKWVQCM